MGRFTLLAALAAISLALPALAQTPGRDQAADSTLSVSGQGEARVAPDEATVRLGVTRQADRAQQAQELVNESATKILAAMGRLGIRPEDISTSQLTLFPVYAPQNPQREEEPKIVAYRASNIVSVRLTKLDLVGRVVDAGLAAGANQVEGVHFGLRNDLAAREQALKQAVAEARQKARTIAAALDVQLDRVIEVQESGVSIMHPMFTGGGLAMAREAAPTPVSPGQVEVRAGVTIRYRIR